MALISKSDFPAYVQFSTNIEDRMLDYHIRDAEQYDAYPVMSDAMLDAIKNILPVSAWNGSNSYVTGDYVTVTTDTAVTYYKALANTMGSQPPSANWQVSQLMNFYDVYLKPFLVYSAYYRFIAYHGANVTQYGVRTINEESSNEVSDRMRAAMLGDISSKRDVWAGKMSKYLSDIDYTLDGVVYALDVNEKQTIKKGVRLFAVGAKQNYICPDDIPNYGVIDL